MSLRLTGSGGSVTSQSIVDAGGVTTDETFFHIFDDTSAIADATRKRFACPFDLEVLSFSVWSLVSVAASATDYWTCDLREVHRDRRDPHRTVDRVQDDEARPEWGGVRGPDAVDV
jgi:hypothetical protein